MSNQFFSLQSLRATSLDPQDPVWEKAILFVGLEHQVAIQVIGRVLPA